MHDPVSLFSRTLSLPNSIPAAAAASIAVIVSAFDYDVAFLVVNVCQSNVCISIEI